MIKNETRLTDHRRYSRWLLCTAVLFAARQMTFGQGGPIGETKPIGPEAVARHEPNRVVAMIDGKQITAQQAMGMLKFVAPAVRREREGQLPKLVQQLYMQSQVALEAVKLHLDRKSPWKEQLQRAHMVITQGATNYPGDPNVPPAVAAQWNSARTRILWNAYFGQAPTKEERQVLLKQEQDTYKIQVQDPDFFDGAKN